ncbi:MAG: metallophosphoesterase [Desulfomonile sp.]|nr:metallophosphoesterase [Desulfomonile sp.]
MDKVLTFLAVLTSLLVLCQWYVFSSLRTYLFRRYSPVTRKVAYPALAIIALANFLFVKLSFGTDIFNPGSFAQQVASVVFFTYLGCVLTLTLYFLLLGLASSTLDLKNLLLRLIDGRKSRREPPAVQCEAPGCLSTPDVSKTCDRPNCSVDVATDRTNSEVEAQTPADAAPELSRRSFLQWGAATGLTTAVVLAGHGISEAYANPVIEEFDLFNPALDGLDRTVTIIQVTDFHFGLFCESPELERLVERLNDIDGDAVVITGDIFHSGLSPIEKAAPVLKRLKARRLGNFAVLGNHDFYAGLERSIDCIERSGLRLLRNEWLTFEAGSTRVHLGGIDDPMSNWVWGAEFPRFNEFAARSPRTRGLRVLLSHRPAILPFAGRAGVDLVLSGHIHGGQIILPVPGEPTGLSIARIASPYTHGWYRDGAGSMYLNRGVGLTFVPWRVNCPPEISVFHLKPSRELSQAVTGTVIRESGGKVVS